MLGKDKGAFNPNILKHIKLIESHFGAWMNRQANDRNRFKYKNLVNVASWACKKKILQKILLEKLGNPLEKIKLALHLTSQANILFKMSKDLM